MSVFLIETKTTEKTEKSMAIIGSDVQTPSPLRLSWFKLGELLIHLRKILTSYQPSARGPYWRILARGRASTDRAERGLYEKRPGANIPQYGSSKLG